MTHISVRADSITQRGATMINVISVSLTLASGLMQQRRVRAPRQIALPFSRMPVR